MATLIDKLTDFQDAAEYIAKQGAERKAKIERDIKELERFLDDAQALFTNAPFGEGSDRNRLQQVAGRIVLNRESCFRGIRQSLDLVSGIANAATSAVTIARNHKSTRQ